MSRYANGEVIDLTWEDGMPEAFVMGHVPEEQARETLERYYNNDNLPSDPRFPGYSFDGFRHVYGRWSMEATWDGSRHTLRDYQTPGRGRFPITMCNAVKREEAY